MVNSILLNMGLQQSLHDPYLFQSVPSPPTSSVAATDRSLHLGLYVDNFVYFSEDSAIEKRFERLLAAKLKVEFMGTVNWFLGTHFEWSSHQDGTLSYFLSQEAYPQNIKKRHCLQTINLNPLATPYRLG